MPKAKKNLYILAACSLLLIIGAIYFLFVFQKGDRSSKVDRSSFEQKSITDVELIKRPFVTLTPTAAGSEIIISIENMSDFDNIEYELTYMADNPQIPDEKIQRGSTGEDVDTKAEKYKKSMLLGTASRGAASPDTGIEDGKLTLHLFKGNTEYTSETAWYLIEAGIGTSEIGNPSGEITIKLPKLTKDYFTIVTETVGIPPKAEFDITKAQLPIYGVFSVIPKMNPKADLTIKNGATDATLYVHNQDGTWGTVDSQTANGATTAEIENTATFVVVSK